jgi:tetratricopeptide (TPR) repeat protein
MVDPEQLGALEDRFNSHMRVHEHLRQYCLAALHARNGDASSARGAIDRLKALQTVDEVRDFVADLALIAEARIAFEAGDWSTALSQLERVREARYVSAGEHSSFFQRADARYLRAECLMKLGRPEEALGWYDAADQAMEFLLIYTGMSHLRQAEANEQLGRQADAIEHYRIFLELFDAPDEFYVDDVARARDRLAALESAR